MKIPDMRTRHAKAASLYMRNNGHGDARPYGLEEIEDGDCWYYYYELPEGVLELEVESTERGWSWQVTNFRPAETRTPALVGR